jgi:phosphoglycerol transferase MdoB-like AlkP superfamily enzyme
MRYVVSVARILLYWYLLFVAARIVFLVFNHNQLSAVAFPDMLLAFSYGFKLDLSMACYLTILPLVLMVVSAYFNPNTFIKAIQHFYFTSLTVVILFVTIADAELYKHWGQKLNAYAASFAKFPREMLVFSTGGPILPLLISVVLLAILAGIGYKKVLPNFHLQANRWWAPVGGFVLSLPILFLGIRGGWGKAAINQSSAFFSPQLVLNHAAVNTCWNLMASLVENPEETNSNPYACMEEAEAKEVLSSLSFTPSGSKVIINTPLPNIVLIVLEGWTADVIAPLGGEPEVTPNLNELAQNGLLYTKFFANGNRTDKGLASIISSQPALAHSSIINNIQKFTSLPSVPAELVKLGYTTSFYYGGASEFANMKGYWLSAGYQQIVDLNDFALNKRNAEWGVHDDVLWDETLARLGKAQAPFFTTVLTLSSHEPFKVPHQSSFKGSDDADLYRNAVHFSDASLGAFFAAAAKQPWYKNTLFVIVSDHGHQWPKNRSAYDPERFHIPLLFVGGALIEEYRGQRDSTVACQVDLASALLSQVSVPYQSFTWSRNFFDSSYIPYATYVYNDGIGMVKPNARMVYDQESKQRIISEGDSANCKLMEQQARAYEQLYFEEYRKR